MKLIHYLLPIFLTTALGALATSLWTGNQSSLYADTKARGIGDLLTVIITESASTQTQASHQTKKDMDAKVSPGTGWLAAIKGLGANASRSTTGSGASTNSTVLTDQLTVTVKALLPNGNLHVEGTRSYKLEKDEQTLLFTGTVRPVDIAPDNTIVSYLVADQNVVSCGKGPISEKQRPGILSRILAFLW
ncbi:MAG TPA: flagellar basal body L-ring protein FlgH [Armatimonadota bacterium]|jgi:flagellar L-ring protein precursor FlgH